MRRAWLAALALAVAAAGCGPDCDAYCNKVAQCGKDQTPPDPAVAAPSFLPSCIIGCNESGSDRSRTISCYIDHTCSDIRAGHCSVTGDVPQG